MASISLAMHSGMRWIPGSITGRKREFDERRDRRRVQAQLPRQARPRGRESLEDRELSSDPYLAWPGHEMRGLRELRRLIDTYPETDVAERARAGLVNLKSQLGVTE